MNKSAHILIAGRDASLLATRGRVLETAGYRISMTVEPVEPLLNDVQLLLVCHTLSAEERRQDLAALASALPEATALCLVPHGGTPEDGIATLDSYGGPREMLRVVDQTLRGRSN